MIPAFAGMTWKRTEPIFSHLPPSRGRKFIINFNKFTLSPTGRGQGEGVNSKFFTASPTKGEEKSGFPDEAYLVEKIKGMELTHTAVAFLVPQFANR